MIYNKAYLTIDDGPSTDMKRKVDYLCEKGIPAIWFLIGKNIEARPDAARYAIEKGHIIGNHSYSHPYYSSKSIDECRVETERTDKLLANIYADVGVEWKAKYFRFPYRDLGAGERAISEHQRVLKILGYRQPAFQNVAEYRPPPRLNHRDVYWNYDCMDWYFPLTVVLKRMDEHQPHVDLNDHTANKVILMHDHLSQSEMLIPIIEKLRSKGLEFVLPDC